MASRPELRQQYELIGSIQPALHVPQNWNYENSAPLFRALMHPPHDVLANPMSRFLRGKGGGAVGARYVCDV